MVKKKFLKNNGRYFKNNNKFLGNSNLGYALNFDGVNDVLALSNLSIDVQFNSLYSFSVWIKPISFNGAAFVCPIFSKAFFDGFGSYSGFVLNLSNGYFGIQYLENFPANGIRGYSNPTPLSSITLGEEVHLVYNNQSKTLFVNGNPVGLILTNNQGAIPVYANYPAYLGVTYVNNPFLAQSHIFDFKVFDKNLTQTEVEELFVFNTIPLSAQPNCIVDIRNERIHKDSPNVYIPERISGLDTYAQMFGYPTGSVGLVDIMGNPAVLTP